MTIRNKNEHFPILRLQEFSNDAFARKDNLLFNELLGDKHIDKPHQHDFFIITLFDQAEGIHNIDFVDYKTDNHQIHLLFPGQVHKWDMYLATRGYQLMIRRDSFERFSSNFRFSIANYQCCPVIQLSPSFFKLIHYEFEAIKHELKCEDSIPELINSRVDIIASIISKAKAKTFNEDNIYKSEPRMVRFQQLIDENFKDEKFVSFYAEKLSISANYLNIICQKYLKVSATNLIQQRIILEAKRLLIATNLSVKQIAFELNFTDHAYFSNFFRKNTGETPKEFRG